jgi:hypothetical protein
MRRLPKIFGVIAILWTSGCLGQHQSLNCPGVTAIKDALNAISEPSPDALLTACLVDYKETETHTYTGVFLVRSGTPRLLKTYIDAGPSGSLAWSPGSRRFAVTLSSGGPAGIWSIDIFNSSTGAWKAVGEEAGHDLLQSYQCKINKERELISAKWDHWITSDEAVIQVSIDPIVALCQREGLMDPVKFRVRIPSGSIVNREP